jgi:phosphoribosylpyrophosphate synthetase
MIFYGFEDYEEDLRKIEHIIKIHSIDSEPVIIVPFKGGLPLGTAVANRLKSDLGILKFQRYDDNDEEVKWIYRPKDIMKKSIWLIDDIKDKGITIQKCKEFLKRYGDVKVITIFKHKNNNMEPNEFFLRENDDWVKFEPWE